ncbi:hypothetical protein [Streptomyces sp. FL07-04A]|uniref:hypothetical protein n=1 Tax=Streptomyces sp. FL07-04A TaxID=3028658 RepID=UPI0029A31F15|nr:hypothetical protein [Streptomyces sp. FL07-04A]MDX3578122.1 hypothetical protein [Streptomyces sp. FL07-04A]
MAEISSFARLPSGIRNPRTSSRAGQLCEPAALDRFFSWQGKRETEKQTAKCASVEGKAVGD